MIQALSSYWSINYVLTVKSTKRKLSKIKILSSPRLSCYQQCKERTGEKLASFQFLIFNGHTNVIRHLN